MPELSILRMISSSGVSGISDPTVSCVAVTAIIGCEECVLPAEAGAWLTGLGAPSVAVDPGGPSSRDRSPSADEVQAATAAPTGLEGCRFNLGITGTNSFALEK